MEKFDEKTTEHILFPPSEILNQTPSEMFSDKLRREILYKQAYDYCKFSPELGEALNERMIYDDISEFIRSHVKSVGKEQAIKDFQCGLNYLNKDFADLIREDGIYGDKTFAAFYEILQYYPLEVIKEAIRKGAKNNLVIEPGYDGNEVSQEEVQKNLTQEII